MFRHPAWALGIYSSGQPAAETVRTKSTEGFHHSSVSTCTYNVCPERGKKSQNDCTLTQKVVVHQEVVVRVVGPGHALGHVQGGLVEVEQRRFDDLLQNLL